MPPSEVTARNSSSLIDIRFHFTCYAQDALLGSWPGVEKPGWEADRSSGLDCLTVLIRHINSFLEPQRRGPFHPERVREEEFEIMRHVWRDFVEGQEKDHAKAKYPILRAFLPSLRDWSFEDWSFKNLVNHQYMAATVWSRNEHRLFHHRIDQASEPAVQEQLSITMAAKSCIQIRRSISSYPFSLSEEVEKKLANMETSDSGRPPSSQRPDFIRLHYIPGDAGPDACDNLQTLDPVNNRTGGHTNSFLTYRYALTAAVRFRSEGESCYDRIRLFNTQGIAIHPGSTAPYANPDWKIGAPGFEYFLLYAKESYPVAKQEEPEFFIAHNYFCTKSECDWQSSCSHLQKYLRRVRQMRVASIKMENAIETSKDNIENDDQVESSIGNLSSSSFKDTVPPAFRGLLKQSPDPLRRPMVPYFYCTRDEENSHVICGSCSAQGHALIDCVWPGPFGDIYGCPMCNTTRHKFDDCDLVGTLTSWEMYHILVSRRANKPPIMTKAAWARYAASDLRRDGEGQPIRYPWTKEFSKRVWKDAYTDKDKQFWLTYDYSQDSMLQGELPVDPMTRDSQTFLDNYDVLYQERWDYKEKRKLQR